MAAMVLWRRGGCINKAGRVQVILLADPDDLRGDAAVMFGKLPDAAIVVHSSEDLKVTGCGISLHADLISGCDSGHRVSSRR